MKKLIFFIFTFSLLIFPTKVFGAVNGYATFVGHTLDQEWDISSNSSSVGRILFSSNGGFEGNFIFADVCTTGNEPTLWITENIKGSGVPSTKWYKVDTPCALTGGYRGDVYRQIIYVTSTSYEVIGDGYDPYYSVELQGRLFNNTSYLTKMRILHLGVSPTIPLEDIVYTDNQTQLTILNDILTNLRNNSSVNQQILDSNNALKNQVQQATQEQQQTNQKLDDIDDTLNDSNVDSSDSTLNNIQNSLSTNNVISDLMLLPVNMLNSLVNAIDGTCNSWNLGSLYGTDLILPCIDIESYLGSTIWTFIDIVCSSLFILAIRKKFIEIFHNITNLKTGGNEVD